MVSSINENNPIAGSPTTQSVRDNFGAAKAEINKMLRMGEDVVNATSTGINTYVADFSNNITLAEGLRICVKANTSNTTGTSTIDVDGTGAIPIVNLDGSNLDGGQISGSNHYMDLMYNATTSRWVLLNPKTIKADRLTNSREIALTGAVSGSVSFSGGGNVSMTTTATPASIGLAAYPVGAIYISVDTLSPATIFGGTWSVIADDLVLATSTADNQLGGTGNSSNTRAITTAEMPAHTHKFRSDSIFSADDDPQNQPPTRIVGDVTGSHGGLNEHNPHQTLQDHHYLTTEGDGDPFNVRQKSFYVKMWQRTA